MANTYGSMDEEKGRLMNKQSDLALDVFDEKDFFPDNPFGENFNADFWEAVNEAYQDGENGKSWSYALSEVRVRIFAERHKKEGKDVFVALMQDVFDQYKQEAEKKNMTELMPSLIQQISEFANVFINDDHLKAKESGKKATYTKPLKCGGNIKKTALHLACERNLVGISELLISLYPGQVYVKSSGGESTKEIPVEAALTAYHDDVASVLVKIMMNERVRQLFEYDEALKKCKFSFTELAKDIRMKKTCLAILDCLINPDFPYVPVQPGEHHEAAWSKIPNLPMRYHVYYQILDGDDKGRPARIKDPQTGKYTYNKEFNHRAPSGLYLIANSPFNSDIIGHPAVRLLIQRKWSLFGCVKSRKYFILYLFYLLMMSLAFFLNVENNDRSSYDSTVDYCRACFEIVTYAIAVIYLISEFDQMMKERRQYLKDVYNLLDLFGLFLILIIPFIKWSMLNTVSNNVSGVEWSVASIAYLINFIRVFKYFGTFKTIGVYAQTFLMILYYDITKFMVVYMVILLGFTGSVYLAIKAEAKGLQNAGLGPYTIFLQEIRALAETNGFADEYVGSFRTTVIILLMVNMFAVIVILSNILIGQISYRYEKANESAFISYDIDRTKAVTRFENSRFVTFNDRIKYYIEGDYITETQVVDELLEDWERIEGTRKPNNSEERIRILMGKIMKKKNE